MPVSATRTTTLSPTAGSDQDSDGFVDFGDVLRHTLVISNSAGIGATTATGVVVNDPLNGSTLTGSVNVSPLAFDDTYTAVGNTLLEVGNATAQTGPQSSVAGSVISNDVEFLGDSFTISAFDATSANGGTVSMVTTPGVDAGSFTYVSAAGFTGTDTFTYTIRDDGLDGVAGNSDDLTSVGTVTITVANKVWYVDSAAAGGGTGTSTNPFNTITNTNLNGVGGAGDADGSGDFIYVKGTVSNNFLMEASEHLVGTGTALVVGGVTLASAGANSSIGAVGAGNTIALSTGNEITGLNIGNAVAGTGGITGTGFGTLTVSNVAINTTGQALSLTTGVIAGSGFTSTSSAGGTNNVSLTSVTGSLNLGSGALSGATGVGVLLNGGNGSFDYNGTVTHTGDALAIQVTGKTGGTVDFDGAVASNTASDGVSLTTNTGATINFDGGLAINTSASNTAGFTATGGGTVSVTGGANSISSGTGTALNLNGVTVGATGVTFATVNNSGGANGVLIDTVGQAGGSTGIDINGGAIVNATTRGVDINATSADVSVAATISTTAAGRSVEVTGSGGSGGTTINFSGAITDPGLGINLDNNDQLGGVATINFTSGALNIDSTTNTGFNATNGGTVTVTGANNSISTTTGVALNVNSTTIGANDLTFHDISANGAGYGIRLNTTGALGGLHITGTGTTDGSGGTIQNITTRGMELLSTADVIVDNVNLTNANTANGTSLDLDISGSNAAIYMSSVATASFDNININGTADNGITGLNVSNFSLNSSTITLAGNAANESGIEFSNLSGTSSIANTDISFSETNTVDIVNTDVNLNLTLNNVVFRDTQTVSSGGADSSNGEGGFQFRSFSNLAGSPTTNIDILDSDFFRLRTQGIQIVAEDDSTVSVDITNNVIQSEAGVGSPDATNIGTGIDINGNDTADVFFNVIGNTIQSRGGHAVNISSFLDADVMGRVNSNIISVTGTGASGEGIRFLAQETSSLIAEARTNTITIPNGNTSNASIEAESRAGSSRLDLTLDNNSIDSASGMVADINILAGSSAASETNTVYLSLISNDIVAGGPTNILRLRVSDLDGSSDPRIFLHNFVEGGAGLDDDAVATWNAGGGTPTATTANVNVSLTGTATAPSAGVVIVPSNPLPIFVDAPPPPPADDAPTPDDPDGSAGAGPQGDLDTSTPGDTGPIVVDDGIISPAEINLIIAAAIERWADAGATAEQIAAMQAVVVSVGDLGGLQVGASNPGVIQVDDNAGGWSWFIDATPGDDAEYVGTGTQLIAADPASQAGTRIDLLTVLTHELGHQIGLSDSYVPSDADQLMFGKISAGERRLPGADDAAAGGGGAVAGALALAPITIGTLPAGKSITIVWDSTLDSFGAGLVPTYTNASVITGSNPGAFNVSSNIETLSAVSTLALDSLTLGGTVWNDNGGGGGIVANGLKDGIEAGVNGVSVTLFQDNGSSAGVWDAGDTQVGISQLTAGGGNYSFTGLAPGDYIVRVDQDNFDSGGNVSLLNLQASSQTIPEPIDPDNNVDNDDNGARAAGVAAYSNAITLAFNTETTADGSGQLDINNTLDFGFHNAAPVVTAADTTVSGTEDTNLVFNAGNGNLITVADVDSTTLTVTLGVTSGVLTLSTTAGLAFTTGDGTADAAMVFSGLTANVNAALNGLIYRGNLNYEGSDTLNVQASDGLLSDSEAIAITLADDGTIDGTGGNDTIVGTPASDLFDLSQGGNDTVTGLGSDDGFYMGAALSPLDNLDGGPGTNDQVGLQGNYGSPFVLGANNLTNIETLVLLPGNDTRFGDLSGAFYDYSLATVDANVAAGQTLTVNFNALRVGEDVTFNGSAETDGSFLTYGGLGNDVITGGAQSDGFFFGNNGRWGAGDSVNGGAGADDQLGLQGSYTVTFGAGQLNGIETLALLTGGDARFGNPVGQGYSYNVTMNNGNVAAGQTLVVNANTLRANVPAVTDETLTFNGAAELDGKFTVYGGAAADTITGGAGNDLIYGGAGADSLTGGAGSDTFAYISAAHSTPTVRDTINDFTLGDVIDLSAIDANTVLGGNDAFSFVGNAAFSSTAGELRFESAGGSNWLVQGDTDGNGVADFAILVTVSDANPITSTDFVL